MGALELSDQELSRLADEAMELSKSYWGSVEERRAYPVTSGEQTTTLFLDPGLKRDLARPSCETSRQSPITRAHPVENCSAMFATPGNPWGRSESCWPRF